MAAMMITTTPMMSECESESTLVVPTYRADKLHELWKSFKALFEKNPDAEKFLRILPIPSDSIWFYRVQYVNEETGECANQTLMKFKDPVTEYPNGDRAIGYTHFADEYRDTAYILGSLSRRAGASELRFLLKHYHFHPYGGSIIVEDLSGYIPLREYIAKETAKIDAMPEEESSKYIRLAIDGTLGPIRALGATMAEIQKCRLVGEIGLDHFVIHPITYSIKLINYYDLNCYGTYTEEELATEKVDIRLRQEAQLGSLMADLFLQMADVPRTSWFSFKRAYFKARFPDYYEETGETYRKYGNRTVGTFHNFLYSSLLKVEYSVIVDFADKLTEAERHILVCFIHFRHDLELYLTLPDAAV